MRWLAPPDRREFFILIFCITVFFLSYNLELSFLFIGLNPASGAPSAVLNRLGLTGSRIVSDDGRRLPVWRDELENRIYGAWPWNTHHVAGNGEEDEAVIGSHEKYSAMWAGKDAVGDLQDERLGYATVDEGFLTWGHDIPRTQMLAHTPGYSILDNVILFNGTVYIVVDSRDEFPPLSSIVSAPEWQIITIDDARMKIGQHGGIIQDVTWISTDSEPHNSTLLSLWHTHTAIDLSIDSAGQTTLIPPRRLFFPRIPFFSDADPPREPPNAFYKIRRRRSDLGMHPFLAKAAFPHLGTYYLQDWADLHDLQVPFLFERIVLADRAVGTRPFELTASVYWLKPVWNVLAEYFDYAFDGGKRRRRPVITYLSRQSSASGSRLQNEDHEKLLKALKAMTAYSGYEVNIISTDDAETSWVERMSAILRSTVVIGVYSGDLYDAAFMHPTEQSTIIEFFPPNVYVADREVVAKSLGIGYMAFCHDRQIMGDALSAPTTHEDIRIDAAAVVKVIQSRLAK